MSSSSTSTKSQLTSWVLTEDGTGVRWARLAQVIVGSFAVAYGAGVSIVVQAANAGVRMIFGGVIGWIDQASATILRGPGRAISGFVPAALPFVRALGPGGIIVGVAIAGIAIYVFVWGSD